MISQYLMGDFLAGYICASVFARCDRLEMHWAKRNLAAVGIIAACWLATRLIAGAFIWAGL